MAVTHRELAELSEQGLVELHRNGHDEAFAGIVRRYQPGLLAHARRRLGSQQAAEDAVQETLLRAYRALPRFNGEYRLGNWLHRILRNVCTDEANRRRRHLALFDRITASEPACAHEAVAADHGLLGREGRSDAVRALDELPESYRTAFVLRAVEELPYDEVAMACGISEENARARVSRARSVLRRTTARFGAFVSVLGVTLRRGNRGSGAAAANAANAATNASTTATAATNVAAGPSQAAIQLTTAIHELGPAAGAAGRAIAVLASAAAVIVPAALSQGGHDDETATERPRTEVSVTAAPEVLDVAVDETGSSVVTTTVPATSTTEALPGTTAAPLRTAGLSIYQLALRPDGDAWTVGGEVAFDTADGLLLGSLEPYSRLELGAPNDWGTRSFALTGYVTLVDGRVVTLRLSGTAQGDPVAEPVEEPTTTTATTAPVASTSTTVDGDRPDPDQGRPPDDLPSFMTTTTAPPPVANLQRPARYGPLPSGTFEVSASGSIDGGDAVGLFVATTAGGVLQLDEGAGTLQLTFTEAG